MTNFIKNLPTSKELPIVLGVVIFGFIFLWSFEIFQLIFQDSGMINSSVSAFAGAFFAFLFLRIGDALEKYYQRQRRHYDALVSMEISLDELGTIIYDNIYLLPGFRATIRSGNVYASLPKPLPTRKDYYEDLHDVKLINDLYKLNYDIRRINDDMENGNNWYLQLRELYTTGRLDRNSYIINSGILSENLKVVQAALQILLGDVVRLNAIVKLRSPLDKPLLTRLVHSVLDFGRKGIAEKQISEKISALNSEIEQSKEDSKTNREKIVQMVSEMD